MSSSDSPFITVLPQRITVRTTQCKIQYFFLNSAVWLFHFILNMNKLWHTINANFADYKFDTENNHRTCRIYSHCPFAVEYASQAQPVNNTCNIDPLWTTDSKLKGIFVQWNIRKKGSAYTQVNMAGQYFAMRNWRKTQEITESPVPVGQKLSNQIQNVKKQLLRAIPHHTVHVLKRPNYPTHLREL
jgi:hypothetical protein